MGVDALQQVQREGMGSSVTLRDVANTPQKVKDKQAKDDRMVHRSVQAFRIDWLDDVAFRMTAAEHNMSRQDVVVAFWRHHRKVTKAKLDKGTL